MSSVKHKTFIFSIFFLIIGFICYISYMSFRNDITLFSFHPVCGAFGWLLMSLAVFCFSDTYIIKAKLLYKQRKKLHWILQTVALLLISCGFICIVLFKYSKNKFHFKTWHSLLGFISMLCCVPAIFFGVAYLYSFKLRGFINPAQSKYIHNIFGIVSYFLITFTLFLSTYSDWTTKNTTQNIQYLMLSIVLVSGFLVIQRPVYFCFKKAIR